MRKARDIVFTINEQGVLTYVSPNCKKILGYDQDEVTGKRVFKFLHPGDVVKLTNTLDDLLKYEYIEKIDIRVIDKNRKWRWFSTNPVVVKKNDEKTRILNMARDITKRKKTELELKKSEKQYRTLFENTGTATLVIEEDGTISLVNQNMVKLSGYSKDEIGDIISPKQRERILQYHKLRREDSSKAPKNYEFIFVTKDGEERYALMNIDVISETNQSIASIIDITERKEMLEELRIKDQAILSSLDAIAISDLEGEITYVNPSFLSMWGYENKME